MFMEHPILLFMVILELLTYPTNSHYFTSSETIAIAGLFCFFLLVEQELRPPLSLQNEELPRIAQRIPRIWQEVALLTKKFEPHDIENISSSRVDEDQTSKALTMLLRFKERQGGRKMLANALKDFNINLSEQVLSGHFIDNDG